MLLRSTMLALLLICSTTYAQLPSLLSGKDLYMAKQFVDSLTAYGPGLGVYAPHSYVDLSYDNIPFVGKIPIFGKEGTSSGLGISPFYPPEGNPSDMFPEAAIYRARPLPMHIQEPVDIVAVPLDEEALHGEPLFPKELVLPEYMVMAGPAPAEETGLPGLEGGETGKPSDPFGNDLGDMMEVAAPIGLSTARLDDIDGNDLEESLPVVIEDTVKEKSDMDRDVLMGDGHMGDGKGSRRRTKRFKRLRVLKDYLLAKRVSIA